MFQVAQESTVYARTMPSINEYFEETQTIFLTKKENLTRQCFVMPKGMTELRQLKVGGLAAD